MTFKYPKIKIIYDLLELIKSNFFFFLIVFVINFNSESTFIIVIRYLFIAIIVGSFLLRLSEIFFTKVVFATDGVRVYTGIFSKSERFIPREKFENVQTTLTVIQRLFNAQTVTMETGDATGDVTLNFVRPSERAQMESYILSVDKTMISTSQHDATVLFIPTLRDILKASLTSFSFLAIIPIALNVWSDLRLDKYVDVDAVKTPLWLTIVLISVAIIVAFAIGIFRTFNSYYRYSISMDDERIYVRKGWLSKQSLSIRKEKVQAVIYKQSWYQKLLGVTTIRLISTGEISSTDAQQINEFFPYLPTAKANELVQTMLPQFTRQALTHRASKKAQKLIWLRPPIFAAIVLLLGLWQPIFYVVGGIVFIFTYINRILTYKNLAFTLKATHTQVRTGAFTVETLVTKRPKLIELSFERSLLQRGAGVMNVKLTNRAQPIHVTTLKDLDLYLQQELTNWFEQRAIEVQIDPKSKDGALKTEAIAQLATILNRKKEQLENH